MPEPYELAIHVRVKGLWRIALLGWAVKLFRLGPQHVKVSINA